MRKRFDKIRLKYYLDNIPAPIHVINKDYTIIYINKKGAEFLGSTQKNCIGKKCFDLFNTPQCGTGECKARHAISEGKTFVGENVIDPKGINSPVQYQVVPLKNKAGEVIGALEHITDISDLKKTFQELEEKNWFQAGYKQLNETMRGDQELKTVSNNIISFLVKYLNAEVGTFYIINKDKTFLELTGSYAFTKRKSMNDKIEFGKGLVGQAAVEQEIISLTDIPKNYLRIHSSTGHTEPKNLLIVPFKFQNQLLGVFEIASFKEFSDKELEFLSQASLSIGVAINTAIQRENLERLLEENKEQTEQLQTKQEELKASNEEKQLYYLIFYTSKDSFWVIDADTGQITDVNPGALKMFNVKDKEQFKTLTPWGVSPEFQPDGEDSKTKAQRVIDTAVKQGSNFFEWVHKTLDGKEFPTQVTLTRFTFKEKVYVGAIQRDVTELKQAEDKLKKQQEELKASNEEKQMFYLLFESSIDSFWILDGDTGEINDANPASLKIFKVKDKKQLKSFAPWQFSPEFQPDGENSKKKAQKMIDTALEQGSVYFEWVHKNWEGEEFPAQIMLNKFTFKEKVYIGAIIRDVTEIKKAEDKLKKQQEELKASNEELEEKTKALKENEEKLKKQQEELKASNEELEEKTKTLKENEEKLKNQQEEMESSNEELEEKNKVLEERKKEIEKKNEELEKAKKQVEQKAKELEVTSKYKSEFLANMSHELRTPLNSLLLLSSQLTENKKGNLDERQVESLKMIHKSGNDLLDLINDVLDISKIEAGKMNVNPEYVTLKDLENNILKNFKHVTDKKGITLSVNIDENCPEQAYTDRRRVEQILKNLLSNAIKFTEEGSVNVEFFEPTPDTKLERSGLTPKDAFAFTVKDTGIGIPEDKQLEIFESFKQQDGSTARKYGGTGLGLSISRELTNLLGGEMSLTSKEGEGTSFTIYLPKFYNLEEKEEELPTTKSIEKNSGYEKEEIQDTQGQEKNESKNLSQEKEIKSKEEQTSSQKGAAKDYPEEKPLNFEDDKKNISKDNSHEVILVIEDDTDFAKIICDKARENGFKVVVVTTGEKGLALAEEYKPVAIILDIKLPGMDGWEVLESLKSNIAIRHIPVHVVSGVEEDKLIFEKGAAGFTQKPLNKDSFSNIFNNISTLINKNIKKLLLIEDDKTVRTSLRELLKGEDLEIIETSKGKEAIKQIEENEFDCCILDIMLSDISGFEVLEKIKSMKEEAPPVIIYTAKELEEKERKKLEKYSDSIILKGVKSEERLIDDVSLFLHQVVNNMDQEKQKAIKKIYENEDVFEGKKVLLVDDDMRNVYALSGLLEEKSMNVLEAENGQEALKVIKENPDIDIIIMDIMMPVMDGYEAIKEIRKMKDFSETPIIALTAKAMPEDRAKCIEAGANDYIPKPLKEDKLFALMRAWLYK